LIDNPALPWGKGALFGKTPLLALNFDGLACPLPWASVVLGSASWRLVLGSGSNASSCSEVGVTLSRIVGSSVDNRGTVPMAVLEFAGLWPGLSV